MVTSGLYDPRATGEYSMNDLAQQPKLADALARMTAALRILDESGAPGEISNHLDLAIARLEERLGLEKAVPPSEGEYFRPIGDVPSGYEAIDNPECVWPESVWDATST
jgi:hypothetical protein